MPRDKYLSLGSGLPEHLRRDIFEPASSDALVEFLGQRQPCESRLSAARLELRFAARIGVILLQCWWLAIGDLLSRSSRYLVRRVNDTHGHFLSKRTANDEPLTSESTNISNPTILGPSFL